MSKVLHRPLLGWALRLGMVVVLALMLFTWRLLAIMLRNQRMLDVLAAYGQSVQENNLGKLMKESEAGGDS